jgi:hypothetical protein
VSELSDGQWAAWIEPNLERQNNSCPKCGRHMIQWKGFMFKKTRDPQDIICKQCYNQGSEGVA